MTTELTAADYARAAATLNVDVAAIRAVVEIEAGGKPFLPDGRPVILFEAHVFHRESKGRFAGRKDRRGVALSVPKWDRSLYGATGANQWNRLEDAAALDWDAAHKACSWGLGQILGTNHASAGHPRISGFVDAMKESAGAQLDAMVAFLKSNKLDAPLRRHDWAAFARGYNGPGYAQNQYDRKLADAHRRWVARGEGAMTVRSTLRLGARGEAVRELQQKLGIEPADGSFGPRTDDAVKEYQRAQGLPADGVVGPRTWTALDGEG